MQHLQHQLQLTIFRLRTGHCLLTCIALVRATQSTAPMRRLGQQTPEDVLQSCSQEARPDEATMSASDSVYSTVGLYFVLPLKNPYKPQSMYCSLASRKRGRTKQQCFHPTVHIPPWGCILFYPSKILATVRSDCERLCKAKLAVTVHELLSLISGCAAWLLLLLLLLLLMMMILPLLPLDDGKWSTKATSPSPVEISRIESH